MEGKDLVRRMSWALAWVVRDNCRNDYVFMDRVPTDKDDVFSLTAAGIVDSYSRIW